MCGILGIVNSIKINSDIFKELLLKLQHRGQESFGISYIEEEKIKIHRYHGMIQNNNIELFKSHFIIGHNRYSTSGKSKNHVVKLNKVKIDKTESDKTELIKKDQLYKETQPFVGKNKCGDFVVVHNGNIFNYEKM